MSTQGVADCDFIVIIATKNRPEALEKYALHSLERSIFTDAVCLLWDASENDDTERVVNQRQWSFALKYMKAPRMGLASQRNDATEYVLKTYPFARYVLFIDDDTELLPDALQGILNSFADADIWGVNIPHRAFTAERTCDQVSKRGTHRRMTPYLYNKSTLNEPHSCAVDWLSGCGMAFRIEVFRDLHLRFPEAFQRFGGYALGEDAALSFYLHKKCAKSLRNSLLGGLYHHSYGSARLDLRRMAASKWYNFHLLFDALYDDIKGLKFKWLRFQFKAFMWAAALKLLIRARSGDVPSVLRGVGDARLALAEYYKTNDGKLLMCKDNLVEDAGS